MRSLLRRKKQAETTEPNAEHATDDANEDLELADKDAGQVAGGADITITKNTDKSSPGLFKN
jgi:hypothetical protein